MSTTKNRLCRARRSGIRVAITVLALVAADPLASCLAASTPEERQLSPPAAPDVLAPFAWLEELRRNGNLSQQRQFAWDVFAQVTRTRADPMDAPAEPAFERWQGEGDTFTADPAPTHRPGIRGFSRPALRGDTSTVGAADPHAGGTPVIAYTLYNEAARQHLQINQLYSRTGLHRIQALADAGARPQAHSIPAFPTTARILKTVWWPVAQDAVTVLPVWDPQSNPALPGGNPYMTWTRVVAFQPPKSGLPVRTSNVEFAGRTFSQVSRVALTDFYHVSVDTDLAERLMSDPESRRTVFIALGRPLAAGDALVLVGGNLATRELHDWIWVAFWWHDHPDAGPFSAGRPTSLQAPWPNYLMSVAFDANKPVAADGGPHICFNPWLEGRFPDGGAGGGTTSNCIACHQRASYPSVDFLPVTRGAPDLDHDRAFEQNRLRTSLLWSLALHAGP